MSTISESDKRVVELVRKSRERASAALPDAAGVIARAGIIGDAEMSRFHRYAMEKLKR